SRETTRKRKKKNNRRPKRPLNPNKEKSKQRTTHPSHFQSCVQSLPVSFQPAQLLLLLFLFLFLFLSLRAIVLRSLGLALRGVSIRFRPLLSLHPLLPKDRLVQLTRRSFLLGNGIRKARHEAPKR